MRDHDPAYVDGLATQLRERPELLRAAENEIQELRGFKQRVTQFLHNPNVALDIRQGLARDLQLPEPMR
ncbi:MAG: hypothetical protein HOV92_12855 [Streptomyces sp.]|nr:hypothetical protein [Streptomyces sp.]